MCELFFYEYNLYVFHKLLVVLRYYCHIC